MTGGWDFVAAAYATAYLALLGYGLALGYRWRRRGTDSLQPEEGQR
jgi:hypothetical protein